MLYQQAGNLMELPNLANRTYLEPQIYESVREVYQTLQSCGVEKFTHLWVNSLLNHLIDVIHHLQQLPEPIFKQMIELIEGLSKARNELRLSLFLFDLEEIDPIRRLVMRNRAVLRGKQILQKMMPVWPLQAWVHKPQDVSR